MGVLQTCVLVSNKKAANWLNPWNNSLKKIKCYSTNTRQDTVPTIIQRRSNTMTVTQ